MKLINLFSLLLVLSLIMSGCNTRNESQKNDTVQQSENSMFDAKDNKILIAYFSWSGNTRALAQEIARQTGGDLFEIIPAVPYPQDYNETVARWHRERDNDERPEVTTIVENMDNYQTIFVGYPIWSSDIPAVVRTFLDQYDFSGKKIIPFCTHGGSRFGRSLTRLRDLCPGSIIVDGFEINGRRVGESADEVKAWIERIGIIQ